MKAILEFNLPEDAREHNLAARAGNMYSSLWELDQWLRGKIKYGHDFKSADEALEASRKELHDILDSNSVVLDDLS